MCHSGFAPKLFDITRGQGRHGQRLVGKHATSQTLPVHATSTPTRRELFGALFSSFAVNRTQCIIGKAAVSVEISYFKQIFIIIYSYIITCHYALSYTYHFHIFIIIYFFHVSNILSIFTTKLRLRCLFSPYIVSQKCLLQLKFNVITFL